MTTGKDDVEFQKKLTATLIEGDPVPFFDNVTRRIDSDALATVLTQETHRDRILGLSKRATVSTNALFLFSGNDLELSGDNPSRFIVSRIEPACERPEERDSFIQISFNMHTTIAPNWCAQH